MGQSLMSIGDILFYQPYPGTETPSFETISREMQATLPSQGRLGRDDAIQFTGPGPDVITVHGRLFPYIFGGINTLDALRTALRAGQPLMMVQFSPNMTIDTSLTSGEAYTGVKIGNFMLRSVKKQSTLYTGDGLPMKIDFTIELVLYGDDLNSATPAAPATPAAEAIPPVAAPPPDGTPVDLFPTSNGGHQ